MATLNITYNGLSADCAFVLERDVSDVDVRRIAVEAVRSGGVPSLRIGNLPASAFEGHVVDRFDAPGGELRIYLRPKVPFG